MPCARFVESPLWGTYDEVKTKLAALSATNELVQVNSIVVYIIASTPEEKTSVQIRNCTAHLSEEE